MPIENPRPKNPNWLRRTIVALTIAGGAAAAAIGLSQRQEPQAVDQNPVPTLTPASSPARTPEPTPTRSPEPTRTPEPTPNPVEQAIKEGKLEVKDGDWEKYFVAITPEEARTLLEKGNSSTETDSRFLLPFDPRKATNLILKDSGFTLDGKTIKVLGVNNLPIDTLFYAQADGSGQIVQDRHNTYFSLKISGNNINGIIFPLEGAKTFFPNRQNTPLQIGSTVARVGSKGPTEYSTSFGIGDFQAVLTMGRNVQVANEGSIYRLLLKEGKIAFIAQAN